MSGRFGKSNFAHDALIKVASTSNKNEANNICNKLDAAGIKCKMNSEQMGHIFYIYVTTNKDKIKADKILGN